MNEKIYITGGGGQLGKALAEYYKGATVVDHTQLDISDEQAVDAINWEEYDTIINAAAYVNADKSQLDEEVGRTWQANSVGPRNLAKVAIKHGLSLVHFSSEYVFDGSVKNHQEDEGFTPLNVYGQTKAAGDIAVSLVPNHYTLRTTWVVGEGHNFVKTMFNLANTQINPTVVDDQYGRLTFVSELVRATDHVLSNEEIKPGTYNLSNSGGVRSWYEIAARTFELAGADPKRVVAVSTDDYAKGKRPFAPRPQNSDLDLSKIQATGFASADYEPLWEEYIERLKAGE